MGGPRSIIGVLPAMNSAAIVVHEERCVKVRNRNVTCLRCAEACTSGCIAVVDERLVVDASKCVGCGTCATVCPTCALEARNPSDAELLQTCLHARRGDEVVVVCECASCSNEEAVAQVVCLGRVDESLASGLAVAGVRELRLECGACEQCNLRHGLDTARMVAHSANELLAAWGSDLRVTVRQRDGVNVSSEPPRVPSISHDETLTPSLCLTPPDETFCLPRVMKDGTLPHFVPDRRERLLDNLATLGQPQAETLSTRLWGCVVIDGSKCSSCRMCATFCPTGALRKFDEAGGAFGIDHFPGDCVKCGSCRDVCPEDAIIIRDEVRPAYLLDGAVHHYVMRPRPVQLGDAHQIVNTMRQRMQGTDIFER